VKFSQPSDAPGCRVLVMCRQRLTREGLRLLLEQDDDLEVVGSAGDASEALAAVELQAADAVVLGDDWRGLDCAAQVRRLKAARPGLPVLVISSDLSPEHVQAVLTSGASGYLPLDADVDELVHLLNSVTRGEVALHPAVMPALLAHLAAVPDSTEHFAIDTLTPREQEVLTLLGRGLSDRDIAQALFVSVRTVQTHLAHIYEKLDVHTRTEAALIAVRHEGAQMGKGPGRMESQ